MTREASTPETPDGARAARLVDAWLRGWAGAVSAHRTWLTDLDAAIGDGDHGINLDRGLQAVVRELGETPSAEAGGTLEAAGRRLMGVVGGASGALYGQALLRAGQAVTADPDAGRLGATALAAAVAGITQLGKASPGDKTMLDALVPALDALAMEKDASPALDRYARAAAAAQAGADATIAIIARKGRASYLGERSAGHRDPGAASSVMLVTSLAEAYAVEDA